MYTMASARQGGHPGSLVHCQPRRFFGTQPWTGMEIITREAAIAAGLRKYFTGIPCVPHGHICERNVYQYRCVECLSIRNAAIRAKDPQRYRDEAAKRRAISPEKHKLQQAQYRAENREVLRQRTAQWRLKNRDAHLASQANYYQRNREARIAAVVSRERNRLALDGLFALKKRVRCLVKDAAARRGHSRGVKTEAILGCSWEFFHAHIERQFLPGMTWENRSRWHIDHIVPMATAMTEAEVLALNHFTNLRPIWAAENLKKGDRSLFLL